MKKITVIFMFFVCLFFIFYFIFKISKNYRTNKTVKNFSEKIVNTKKINNENEFISFYDYSNHGKEVFFKYSKEFDKGELFINSNLNDLGKDQNDLISLIDTLKTRREISFGDDGDDLLLKLKDKKGLVSIPYIKNENGKVKAYLTFSFMIDQKNNFFEIN